MADHLHQTAPTTRDRLVTVAEELLEEGGPAAVTFREVGRRAGFSHNAAHKLFGGKEELLAAVAARGLTELRIALNSQDSSDPVEAVRQMMYIYAEQAVERPRRFELTYGSWSTDLPELESAADAARGRLEETVVRAQQLGQIRDGDPARLTALLQSMAHGASQLALTGHLSKAGKGKATPADLIDDLLRAVSPQSQVPEISQQQQTPPR